jgi:uncharacterized protein YjbI with pentapeptide repeats
VHAYVLLHFRMLTGKVRVFDQERRAQIDPDQDDSDTRARLRRQLPNDIFVQFLAGPPEVRRGVTGALLKLIAWISLVLGPILLLGFFQLQFLAYHSARITWCQRFAMSLDLILLWLLWPAVVRSARGSVRWRGAGFAVAGIATVVPLFLVFLIASFPGEWQLHLQPFPLQKLLVAGPIDHDVTDAQKPSSLWSSRLVLAGFDVIDHVKFDSQQKIAALPVTASLRTRDLHSAALIAAGLPKVDFTAAHLEDADLFQAHLEGAVLDRARLERTELSAAHLEGAYLREAHLEGARLTAAHFEGADLQRAHLEGADLQGAHLEGADFTDAHLEGANLTAAHFEGADLHRTHLEGALLKNAQLRGVLLIEAFVWHADLSSAVDKGAHVENPNFNPCPDGKSCSLQASQQIILEQRMLDETPGWRRVRTAALERLKNLDSSKLLGIETAWEQRWRTLEQLSSTGETHKAELLDQWRSIGCAFEGSPYVFIALTGKMEHVPVLKPQLPGLAAAFLDPACVGGRGMSKATRAKLEELSRHAGPQAAPAP